MARLHDIMLRHSSRLRDRVAIATATESWSYGELATHAERYADQLRSVLPGPGSRVVLLLDHGPDTLALIAACSMIGVAFVPIDPHSPPQRLDYLLRLVEPACVVARTPVEPIAQSAIALLSPGGALEITARPEPAPARDGDSHSDAAYIVFTSGSTGQPKGIVMSHRAVTAFVDGLIDFYGLPEGDIYASCSPVHFDFALLDMGLCLGSGATLYLPNRARIYKPGRLIEAFRAAGAQHISGVPTIWRLILQFARERIPALSELKRIVFAGEHFPIPHIQELYQILPGVRFINIYGQSETIACTFCELPAPIPASYTTLPVGTGHPGLDLMLLDDDGDFVEQPGRTGELFLSGDLLFTEYWRNPEQTRQRLVTRPGKPGELAFRTGDLCYRDERGVFFFVGRKDHQVQIYGNRVELEEIESVLGRFEAVVSACVVFDEGSDSSALHAFVLTRDRGEDHAATDGLAHELRKHCADLLPPYMVPRNFHIVDSLPLLSSGKLDRDQIARMIERG